MIIAAHCLNFQKEQQNYLLESLLALAAEFPQHHFLIFCNTEITLPQNLKNISCLLTQPAIKNKLSGQYWYRFKAPGILQRKGVNIFISEAGMLCKKLSIPQYIYLRPENKRNTALNKTDNFPFKYPKLFFSEIKTAEAVLLTEPALEAYIKNKEIPSYPVYHDLPPNYKPISFEEKEAWIDAHNEGCDFFVFHVSEATKAQVLPMLKAFSIFKKWTESTMRLVLMLHCPFTENDIPKFNLYKFRNEVKFINFTTHQIAATLYAAAFLHIYLPEGMADENFALLALQTQTGLLIADKEILKLNFGAAAAYCQLNEKAISEKLLYYYKSDFEKDKLIAEALPLLKHYSLKNSAAKLAAIIGI